VIAPQHCAQCLGREPCGQGGDLESAGAERGAAAKLSAFVIRHGFEGINISGGVDAQQIGAGCGGRACHHQIGVQPGHYHQVH
jgi:hypothetical protein